MDTDQEQENITFKSLYQKVLQELDVLHRGVYDPTEATSTAALCLLAQASLIRAQATADLRSRSLKRDIDFAKAEAYSRIKISSSEKKLTEVALTHLINQDVEVHKLFEEQNIAEKESKELLNILNLLRDAHLTFRSFAKKEG